MPKRMLILAVMAAGLVGGLLAMAQGPKPLDLPPLVAEPTELPATPVDPPTGLPQATPAIASDDPMQVVEAFVARNRKEAEDSIKTLSVEAETLRARLQKVEAALGRWKAVENALKSEGAPTPVETIQKK